MSFSISNVQAHKISVDRPRPSGNIYKDITGINFTYHVTNQDGSIGSITRHRPIHRNWNRRWYQDKDPTLVVTCCEQMDRGQIPRRGELVKVINKVCIKASDMEIMLSTQQQLINNQQQTITQLHTQIQNILQNIQALKAANADLRAQQGSLQQQIDRLQAEVTAQEAMIATIPALNSKR